MAKRNRTGNLRRMEADAQALEAKRTDALAAFLAADFRGAVVAARSAVTVEMFTAYRNAYAVAAWYALPEGQVQGNTPSANDMLRVFAGLAVDTKTDDSAEGKALKAEVNFSDYVRNRSPHALAAEGKPKRGSASKVTAETFLKTVNRLVVKVKPSKAEPSKAVAILKAVKAWADAVATAHGQPQQERTGTNG